MTTTIRNPYKVPQGFCSDPFTPLYHQPDEKIELEEPFEDLLDYANILEDKIAGDFNLSQIINDIKGNFLSFVRTGLLAYKVKIWKLYRKSYRNFKTFCEEALGVTHWQINRTIEAARVVMELVQSGFSILPQCEAQARPLTKFTGAELCANWQIVVENLPPSKITGNSIAEVLGMESTTGSIRLPKEFIVQLRDEANALGLSLEEYLRVLHEERNVTTPPDEETIAAWQEDLVRMTKEYEAQGSEEDKEPIGTNFSCSATETTSSFQKEENYQEVKEEDSVTIGTSFTPDSGQSTEKKTTSQSKAPKTFFDLMNPQKTSKVFNRNKSKKAFQSEKKRAKGSFDYQGKDDS